MRRPSLILCLCLSLSLPLGAGNLEKFPLGDDAAMQSGAILATGRGNDALWYNPAGLAVMPVETVDLDMSAYAARYYDVPGIVQIQLPDRHASMDFYGTSFFSTPAAVVVGRSLKPGVGLAAAFYTRDQLDLLGVFSNTFYGTNASSNPYSYEQGVSLDLRAKNYLAALGLGWQTRRWLRVGFTALGEYVRQAYDIRFWGDYIDLSTYNSGTGLYGVRTTTHTDQRQGVGDYGLRGVAGLQADLGHGLALGLDFRSPRFSLYQDLDIDLLVDGNFVAPGQGVVVQTHFNGSGASLPLRWEDVYQAEAGLAWTRGAWTWSAQTSANDLPAEQGSGMLWNWKAGVLWALAPAWSLGAGAYSDYARRQPLTSFVQTNTDYYGGNVGLRYRHGIGGEPGKPSPVEMSTTLALHYERGSGAFAGAQTVATSPNFPLPVAVTSDTFQEANLHLASGLTW